MITTPRGQVYLATGVTDMRKSINTLVLDLILFHIVLMWV